MKSHTALGPGHREDIYQHDLELRLQNAGIAFDSQRKYEVYDTQRHEVVIGFYIPDFVILDSYGNSVVIVEIKALPALDNNHLAQVIGYLAVSGCSLGLLLNFGTRSLHQRRIFPPENILEHRVNHNGCGCPTGCESDWSSRVFRQLIAESGEKLSAYLSTD